MNIETITPNSNHSNELLPSFYFRFYSRMFNFEEKNKEEEKEQKEGLFKEFTKYLKSLKETNEQINNKLKNKNFSKKGNKMHNFLRINELSKKKEAIKHINNLGSKIIKYYGTSETEKQIMSMNKNLEEHKNLVINTKRSEFYGSVAHHGSMDIVQYKVNGENGNQKNVKKIYKYIVDTSKKRGIELKIAKVFIEFTIHSILEYVYNLYLPSLDYLAFYNVNNLSKTIVELNQTQRRTEKIKIVMDYIEGLTLKEFIETEFKLNNNNSNPNLTIINAQTQILKDIIMQLCEILYLYQYRCNFIHGELIFENIMLKVKKNTNSNSINYELEDLKLIDFGSSSICVKINGNEYLIYDIDRQSEQTYLNTINKDNKDFAFSCDLLYFILQIGANEHIHLKTKKDILELFELNSDISYYINQYNEYINEIGQTKRSNILNKTPQKKILTKSKQNEKIKEYTDYKKHYVLNFIYKIKEIRDAIFKIDYQIFHPLNVRNTILKTIFPEDEIERSLPYIELYGINNMFGLTTYQKYDFYKMFLYFLMIDEKKLNEKCDMMIKIDKFLNFNSFKEYKNVNKNHSEYKFGKFGRYEYLDIYNKGLKIVKYKNQKNIIKNTNKPISNINKIISNFNDPLFSLIIEYIIGYYLTFKQNSNISNVYSISFYKGKVSILMKNIFGKHILDYNEKNNSNNETKQNNNIKMFSQLGEKTFEILNRLFDEYSFIHGDINLQNIIYKIDEQFNITEINIIDFGLSSLLVETENGTKQRIVNYMRNKFILDKYEYIKI